MLNETLRIQRDISWTRKTFYEAWQEGEGVPTVKGTPFVEDVRGVTRGPWRRLGGNGAILNLADQQEIDIQLIEIPPGRSLNPERHLYEEIIIVLEGRGETVFRGGTEAERTAAAKETGTLKWQRGSLFSPPLNCWHQHRNASTDDPVLLMAATNLPSVLNRFRSLDFIFNNNFNFEDRFPTDSDRKFFEVVSRPDFASYSANFSHQPAMAINFIRDVMAFEPDAWPEKGPGVRHTNLSLAENSICAHIHEIPVGTYARAHRHGPGANVFVLDGEGYELLWLEGEKEKRKHNFHAGSVLSPRAWEYHQHFNTGKRPLRQLALRLPTPKYTIGWQYEGADETEIVDYAKEEPNVILDYRRELASKGINASAHLT